MSKATSLSKAYNDHRENGAVLKKTFLMPLDVIVCDVDNNIRPLNAEHVAQLASSYQAGQEVPPIYVHMEDGFPVVIDGHHRYHGALAAGLQLIECKEFKGTDADRKVFMFKSADGLALTFLEKALAIKALHATMDIEQIGLALSVSRTDVGNKLALAEADPLIHTLVREEAISGTMAVEYIIKYGVDALARINFDLDKALTAGKTKVTAASGKASPFSPAKMRAVMELLGKGLEFDIQAIKRAEDVGGAIDLSITLDVDEAKELLSHIDEYVEHTGGGE